MISKYPIGFFLFEYTIKYYKLENALKTKKVSLGGKCPPGRKMMTLNYNSIGICNKRLIFNAFNIHRAYIFYFNKKLTEVSFILNKAYILTR